MSTNVPLISVTEESVIHCKGDYEHHVSSTSSDSDDSYSNDMDYNQNIGGLTDVEDFDSSADAGRLCAGQSSKDCLVLPKGSFNAQDDLTDVEDYNDSEADEENDKSAVYPELKLSLNEFLQYDFQEYLTTSNTTKETVEHKSGNFLKAQNLNAGDDYLTDCEDFNTDSEMENNYEKSACIDLKETFGDEGNVNIADSKVNRQIGEDSDDDNDDVSIASDISSMAFNLSDAADKELQNVSENEILELSNEEEAAQISFSISDSVSNSGNVSEDGLLSSASLPPIDVTFIHPTSKQNINKIAFINPGTVKCGQVKKMFLDVEEKRQEEVLTDIERFDDSVADGEDYDSFDDDEENNPPIPQAVVVGPDDDVDGITDCEDLFYDDVSEAAAALSIDVSAIPLAQREVVMLQENKFGDTITSVMPMEKEYQFGIYATPSDECLTDTEEYSCTDEINVQISLSDLPSISPSISQQNVLIESDVTVANEMLKIQQSKRLEIISNTESVTDVEEIYMAGTNIRKKKLKSRPVSKNKSSKQFLETPMSSAKKEAGGTDIEDIDLSDSGLMTDFKGFRKTKTNHLKNNSQNEKQADEEDVTPNEVVSVSVSEAELLLPDVNTNNLQVCEASGKSIVVSLQNCESNNEFLSKNCLNSKHICGENPQTNVKDAQLPADTEECIYETLQTYIPEPQQNLSIETIATQGTLNKEIENKNKIIDGGDDDDEDADADEDEDEENSVDEWGDHDKFVNTDSIVAKSLPSNIDNVRQEATHLIDNVLEETMHIVNEQHYHDRYDMYDIVADNDGKAEYNSESENYAITCDNVDGLDVIKSPTIESMSGKSFDDNLSLTDGQIATIPTTYSQEQFQMSPYDGTKLPTVESSVAQETKSTDSTVIPPATIATSSPTQSYDTDDVGSNTKNDDVPKPKPRYVRISTPTENDDEAAINEKTKSLIKHEINEQDVSRDSSDDLGASLAPVPKPRSQIKATDSFKNLESLHEQQVLNQQYQPSQSDSVSLRSFDYTEETSRTDDPSVSVSISTKSQNFDYSLTGTTTKTTTTTSEDPATESVDPPSELSVDDGNIETERRTSFYIGESSRNIITKTTPTKLSASEGNADEVLPKESIETMKEPSVDYDEENDVFKEYVTIKTTDLDAGTRIRRQSSETRNDLLEEDSITKETIESTKPPATRIPSGIGICEENLHKTSTEQSLTTATTTSTASDAALLEVIHSTGEDDSVPEISESIEHEAERPTDLNLSLEKSEWETAEKEIPLPGVDKIFRSPQQPILSNLNKEELTEEIVHKTLQEVQESLDAAKNELKSVLKNGKSIKDSPSEFEVRPFAQIVASSASEPENIFEKDIKEKKNIEETVEVKESEDISSFIGIPEHTQGKPSQEAAIKVDSLNREAAMLHYAQSVSEEIKTDNIVDTSEHVENFSSMEEYYQEKLAKIDVNPEFEEIQSEHKMKPVEDIAYRIKTDSAENAQNRWSLPEIDQSSSSESYYKSFEKTDSQHISTDMDNVTTQANSSEYQTAVDASSSVYRETPEFVSAVSRLESSSGKTISSHESMRSLDSQSETSANLGSIDVSELSETLVASSTEETEDIERLRDLAAVEDSDESLDLEETDYTIQKQSQMKRSQEMIFKPKCDETSHKFDEKLHPTVPQIEEQVKSKEIEKTWGLVYPMAEAVADDIKDSDEFVFGHGEIRCDDSKYASSFEDGSILSVSMSSTSNIDTVVENVEELAGSVGASSLTGIEGFSASSLPEETTFAMDLEEGSGYLSPQYAKALFPSADDTGDHKSSEVTSSPGDETQNIVHKDTPAMQSEGKESESESDTDPYETEYARQFRSPTDRRNKKKKPLTTELDFLPYDMERPGFAHFNKLISNLLIEDSVREELEAKESLLEEKRTSQNVPSYANIPDITVTEETQPKLPSIEKDTFEEKSLYKMKTEEQLHKAKYDRPLHEEKKTNIDFEEESFQKLVQDQYKQKLAELKKVEISDSNYDYNKTPDSPDSFEMIDQPDITDDFVIIEEVAKEANEDDVGGKSIRIAATKYESKHDEEVEKILIKSAPADPKLGSQIFRDDLNFEFEESPPTVSSGGAVSEVQDESDSGSDLATNNKRWVEMQLNDQLRYPYDLTGGVLEDIKEEDGEFEVGSSRISSFKDSFSSTPDYDVMAARRYYAARGEHDDVSMSSLQEFESLEQAISLENRNRTHQGSTDSSNGSFQRRYILRNSTGGAGTQGDDISISSLKEFEGIENACIEAHLIEIKAKEEAALLSRSDESNKSNSSDHEQIADPSKGAVSKIVRVVAQTKVTQSSEHPSVIENLLKQKLLDCERAQNLSQITENSEIKTDSGTRSVDSAETKDATTRLYDKKSTESIKMEHMDDVTSKLRSGISTTTTITTTRTDEDAAMRTITKSLLVSSTNTTSKMMPKNVSAESLNQLSATSGTRTVESAETKDGTTRLYDEKSTESIKMEHMDDVTSKLKSGISTTTTITTTRTDEDGAMRTITKSLLVSSTNTTSEIMPKNVSAESLNQLSATDQTTSSSAGTTATYQTSAGNSQMTGSITSCSSSTLMDDSAMSLSGLMSSSYWSREEESMKENIDAKPRDAFTKEDPSPSQ